MNTRPRLALVLVVLALAASAVLGTSATALAAPKPGTGGWYWPTGTEKLGSMDGYWVYRASNHSWHMAKDIATPNGHPVYAIADGTVAESSPDSGYGGVLVIWHKTGAGEKFLTVYGHIKRKNLKKGDHVTAGQAIGAIASPYGHLHFGIHPGNAYPPDGNPFRGHTYDSSQTYGWVDPIKFLREHPAYVAPNIAPALPLVTTISCPSTPTVMGVGCGQVYWKCVSEEDSDTIYCRGLRSGETTEVASSTVLPTLENMSYLAVVHATDFQLFARRPSLTAKYSADNPEWKHPIFVTGSLKNAAGKPFSGATVCVQRSIGGGAWTTVTRGTTSAKGAYQIGFAPTRSCSLRVSYTPTNQYVSVATTGFAAAPKPGVCAPDSATQAAAGGIVTVCGTLGARHKAGAKTVTLLFQLPVKGVWTDQFTASATNANGAGGTTRYSAKVKLAAGVWRVRAICAADSLHAAEKSVWKTIKVK